MKTEIEKPLYMAMILFKNSSAISFLHTLSDSISDAIIITDSQFTIEYWNKAASQSICIYGK